jgi:large subunit ribosomal protein L15
MLGRRKKKSARMRGAKTTHGYGSKKKHRGSGHTGGVGNAGSGKRGDSKKPSYWADQDYYGKHGFFHHGLKVKVNSINIRDIEQNLKSYLVRKLVEEKNGVYFVDLKHLGFNKLLGSGKVTMKFNITTEFASKNVVEKVKEAGGEVTVASS